MEKEDGLGRLGLLTIGAVALNLGLACRLWLLPVGGGPNFTPIPDALEYVAGAQAIADQGRYFLQVGPWEVRPRYPPGLSLLLAPLLAAGVPANELWRVKLLAGLAIAATLGGLVAWLLRREGARPWLATAFGSSAAAFWIFLPVNVRQGPLLMADEPALLLSLALIGCLAATARGPRPRVGGWLAAGFCAGWVALVRPTSALQLAFPLAIWLVGRLGWRGALRGAGWATLGALPPLALASGLLAISGFPPFQLSAYGYWTQDAAAVHEVWNWRWALSGNPKAVLPPGQELEPHLLAVVRQLIGGPGSPPRDTFGLFWPLAGWVLGWLWWRGGPPGAVRPRWLAWSMVAGVAAHVAFYALYAYLGCRFLLPPALLCALGLWLGLGWLAQRGKAGAAAAAAIVLLACWGVAAPLRAGGGFGAGADLNAETPGQVAAWRAQSDAERAAAVLPFDPLRAQALGLLPASVVREIGAWGTLPPTRHIARLIRFGQLERGGGLGSAADPRYIHAAQPSKPMGEPPPRGAGL